MLINQPIWTTKIYFLPYNVTGNYHNNTGDAHVESHMMNLSLL